MVALDLMFGLIIALLTIPGIIDLFTRSLQGFGL